MKKSDLIDSLTEFFSSNALQVLRPQMIAEKVLARMEETGALKDLEPEYDRMNPTIDGLIEQLKPYSEITYGKEAYHLSVKEAKVIIDAFDATSAMKHLARPEPKLDIGPEYWDNASDTLRYTDAFIRAGVGPWTEDESSGDKE